MKTTTSIIGITLNYQQVFRGQIDPETLETIRETANKGLALGDDRFRQEIERLTGVRVSPGKRGPKSKAADRPEDQQEFLL